MLSSTCTACRLHAPFPELQSLALSFDLDTVDELTHKHIPFGELLNKGHGP